MCTETRDSKLPIWQLYSLTLSVTVSATPQGDREFYEAIERSIYGSDLDYHGTFFLQA